VGLEVVDELDDVDGLRVDERAEVVLELVVGVDLVPAERLPRWDRLALEPVAH